MSSKKVILACALCIVYTVALVAASLPEAGQPAPQFTLKSQDGTPVSLNDYRGKWVVLYFYPKDMTTGCTIEAHNFERDLAQYQQRNAVILGVSVDSVDSHKQFCVKENLSFKLLSDADHVASTEYGTLNQARGMDARNTFLIDPNGNVAKVFTDVSPSQHSAEVLAAIDSLQKH
ncbi:MAG TPA: peroxiredoxin [Candidatus Acidoferrales bacterium]|nr:peroxiredoxin [Candidatus Acidoferrales bacterium]